MVISKHKLTMVITIITLLIIFAGRSAFSATYYIDFDHGSDSNSGTSANAAWKRCPGDLQATDRAAGNKLAPGDQIIFKGGVVYKGSATLQWSGTSGNIITYDGNSAGTWGTGKAIIDGEKIDSPDRKYGFYASAARNYIIIRNFEIKRMGGGPERTSCSDKGIIEGHGVFFERGASHVTVKDCRIYDMGSWENKPYQNQGYMGGVAIFFQGSSDHIIVDNIDIFQVGRAGVYFSTYLAAGTKSVSNIEVKNCDVHHHFRWGIYFGAGTNGSTFQNISIHNNIIRDMWHYSGWLGCKGAYPHYDGIMLTTNSYKGHTLGTPERPIRIHGNQFYINSDVKAGGGTAEIFMTAWGGTVYIYNNVFKNWLSHGLGAIYGQGMSRDHAADYHICNNSFYGGKSVVMIRDLGGVPFSGNRTVNFINNAIYSTNKTSVLPIIGVHLFTGIKNNIIYSLRSDGLIAAAKTNGAAKYYTVTSLNALDNASGNIGDDPLFADISYGLGENSSLNDIRLRAGSPGINAGLNLSGYFTTDFSGNTRAGKWDIGAYERKK
ncbi:MAG: right-handed parallel beta-helix repeat-containing protein [Smithella sp.]|jgi:hypothetical protein